MSPLNINEYLPSFENLFIEQKLVIRVFETGQNGDYHLHLICFTDKKYTKIQMNNFIFQKFNPNTIDLQIKIILYKNIFNNVLNYLFKDVSLDSKNTLQSKIGFLGHDIICRDIIKSLNYDLTNLGKLIDRITIFNIYSEEYELSYLINDVTLIKLLIDNLNFFYEKNYTKR